MYDSLYYTSGGNMALKNNVTKKYYDLMKARDQSEKSLGKLENRPFSSPLGRLFVILFSVATSLYSGITGVNSAVDDSSVVGKLFGFLPAGTVGTVLLWVISLLGLWLFEIGRASCRERVCLSG